MELELYMHLKYFPSIIQLVSLTDLIIEWLKVRCVCVGVRLEKNGQEEGKCYRVMKFCICT